MAPKDVARRGMRSQTMPDMAQVSGEIVVLMRWPCASQVAKESKDHRLVDGHPPLHQVAEASTDIVGVCSKTWHDLWSSPTTGFAYPDWVREVMQGDDWFKPGSPDRLEDLTIVVERRMVDDAGLRLDARPFNRHAISVQPELVDKLEIFSPAIPRLARVA